MSNLSWNFSRSPDGSGPSWLDYLRDPARSQVLSDEPADIVRALVNRLPASTLRLLGSQESLEAIFESLSHPSNGFLDPTGIRLSAQGGFICIWVGGRIGRVSGRLQHLRSVGVPDALCEALFRRLTRSSLRVLTSFC